MKLRTSLILVLVTGLLLALAFLLVFIAGRTLQFVQKGISGEVARQEFVSQWRRPAELDSAHLFPDQILDRRLGPVTNRVTDTRLNLNLPGAQGRYEVGNLPGIAVSVFAVNDLEREGIRQRARSAFTGPGAGAISALEMPDRLRLSRSHPPSTLEIWSLQGWCFLFQTEGELPAEFIRAYLSAVSAGRSSPRPVVQAPIPSSNEPAATGKQR